jgi:hypothetical protein
MVGAAKFDGAVKSVQSVNGGEVGENFSSTPGEKR